ncbi:hypothetical protein EG329_004268 [Mollisiaceae sp. DMI_Dod_QoI]|nr:hypothetical protein EG329_004268 [Helotiales sp. DMI_Dod_QoI]
MITIRRRTYPEESHDLHLPPSQTNIEIQQTIQPVLDSFRRADEVCKLDEVIAERDTAEKALEILRERGREDRDGFAELKKKLTAEKKSIQDECAGQNFKVEQLSATVLELEEEKLALELKSQKDLKLTGINKMLCEELERFEAIKNQFELESEHLRNENTNLLQQNSSLANEKVALSGSVAQWEDYSKEVIRYKTETDDEIKQLRTQVTDLSKKAELWRQDVVHRDDTIIRLKDTNEKHKLKLERVAEAIVEDDEPQQKRPRTSLEDDVGQANGLQSHVINTNTWPQAQSERNRGSLSGFCRVTDGHRRSYPVVSPLDKRRVLGSSNLRLYSLIYGPMCKMLVANYAFGAYDFA